MRITRTRQWQELLYAGSCNGIIKARPHYSLFPDTNTLTTHCSLFADARLRSYIKILLPEKLSLNSLGVQPFFLRKMRLKLEILLNPQHTPLFWRYDLNYGSNPYLVERFGINAIFACGYLYDRPAYRLCYAHSC